MCPPRRFFLWKDHGPLGGPTQANTVRSVFSISFFVGASFLCVSLLRFFYAVNTETSLSTFPFPGVWTDIPGRVCPSSCCNYKHPRRIDPFPPTFQSPEMFNRIGDRRSPYVRWFVLIIPRSLPKDEPAAANHSSHFDDHLFYFPGGLIVGLPFPLVVNFLALLWRSGKRLIVGADSCA